MTRRSITGILGSLVVGLLLVVNAPAVSAGGPCILDSQGNCAQIAATVSPDVEVNVNRVCHFTLSDAHMCAVFQTDGTWLRDETAANGGWIVTAVAVAVADAPSVVAGAQQKYRDVNTNGLPGQDFTTQQILELDALTAIRSGATTAPAGVFPGGDG